MKNTNWRTIAFALATPMLALVFSFGAHSDEVENFFPDHYLSYDIKTPSIKNHKIKLRDQFIDWTSFVVSKPIKLLNPTVKRHNNQVFEIKNPKLHYTAFELELVEDVHVNVPVVVINQFGTFTLDQFRPDRLLAPTRKKLLTPFDAGTDSMISEQAILADHYLCYEIPPFDVSTQFGFLKDQFRSREFQNLIARRFCNPVAKIHDNQMSEIINDVESNHLMCFEIDKQRIFRVVALLNQFGLRKAIVTKDDEICVPSIKFEIPQECEGSAPNEEGICNGICPNPRDACQVDPVSQRCTCFPQEPSFCFDTTPDSDGICNGFCPDPSDVCVADATGQCNCLPTEPRPCFDSVPDDNGQCNGDCPAGEVCLANADFNCECRPQVETCGFSADGQCGGICPPQEICTIIPGTNFCGCVI